MHKVLHTGPNKDLKGGISSAIRNYISSNSELKSLGFEVDTYATLPFSRVKNILHFILSIFTFPLIAIKYDIIHLHVASKASFYRKLVYFLISKALQKKTVFHLHGGGFIDFYESSNTLSKKLIERFIKQSDGVIFVSSNFQHLVSERIHRHRRSTVIPNSAPEFENLPTPINSNQFESTILFCGMLAEHKGLMELLRAISILKRQGKSTTLVIAGNGDIEHWKSVCSSLEISDSVSFKGWVSGDEKRSLYEKASVFCMPSHVESFGISVLEAMLVKLPVIGTNIGGFLDLIEDNVTGYLVPTKSPDQIAEKIVKLIDDPTTAIKMGERGYQRAKSLFTNEQLIAKTSELYSAILSTD